MVDRRIEVVQDGQIRPAAPCEPISTSGHIRLDGFLLEKYGLPAGELGAAFLTHMIGLNLGGDYWQEWRTEGLRRLPRMTQ